MPAGRFQIGSDVQGFTFDNELHSHEVTLGAVRIDAQIVSWARFLPFIEAGSYERNELWSQAGGAWLAGQPLRLPANLRYMAVAGRSGAVTGGRP